MTNFYRTRNLPSDCIVQNVRHVAFTIHTTLIGVFLPLKGHFRERNKFTYGSSPDFCRFNSAPIASREIRSRAVSEVGEVSLTCIGTREWQ